MDCINILKQCNRWDLVQKYETKPETIRRLNLVLEKRKQIQEELEKSINRSSDLEQLIDSLLKE